MRNDRRVQIKIVRRKQEPAWNWMDTWTIVLLVLALVFALILRGAL